MVAVGRGRHSSCPISAAIQARNRTFLRGVRAEGADGEGSGEGYPLPSRLGGLGECRKLPQWGLGGAANEFYAFSQ